LLGKPRQGRVFRVSAGFSIGAFAVKWQQTGNSGPLHYAHKR
jgi:hypothetical protein